MPDSVYQALKREAQQQGRSLNSQIIRALEEQTAEVERRQKFAAVRKKIDRFAKSIQPLDSSAPLIREDRDR